MLTGCRGQATARTDSLMVHLRIKSLYEAHETYVEAARREKRFKNWCRQWKLNAIEAFNSECHDLYEEIY